MAPAATPGTSSASWTTRRKGLLNKAPLPHRGRGWRAANAASRVRVLATARPSPSQPCRLGPSLSRGAGEGLFFLVRFAGRVGVGFLPLRGSVVPRLGAFYADVRL